LEGGQSLVKIYLDAGHGGKDSGAVGNGIYEKNINLDLVNRIEAKLKEYGNVQVLQTRTTDVFLELTERTDKANAWGADCFLSIHCNSAGAVTTAKGYESHIFNGPLDSKTVAFQNTIHTEVVRAIAGNTPDRGKKRSNFHVLRESHMTALLGENLFVTNISDAALLKTTTFLERLAQGYVTGLEKFFGLVKETRPPTVIDSPEASPLYQVISGTYADRDNAEAQVKKLTADGYSSFIQVKE
jgi:N-acetylmuramoyl-L-alanine amidase